MGDAAAAMGIANIESTDKFIKNNLERYNRYRELLLHVPGVHSIRHEKGSTYQSMAIEVDPRHSGISRDALANVLIAENVGVAKPFEGEAIPTSMPVASRLGDTILQLPSGPNLQDEDIEAVCKLIELAIVS
jgi:dTDP-4-amino-4,6-dideoxygalactose transaminase